MPLETGTYIDDLLNTNPPGTDQQSEGDDHLRLIKDVLQNSLKQRGSTGGSASGAGVLAKELYAPTIVDLAANHTVAAADENSVLDMDATGGALTVTLPNSVSLN